MCEVLRVDKNAIFYVSQPGFSRNKGERAAEKKLAKSVFFPIGQMGKIIDSTKKVGDKWSGKVFSYTFNPMTATAEIESDKESVSVPAEEFNNCLKVKYTITPSNLDYISNRKARLNLLNSGTKEMWYAPGVGLVRLKIHQGDGLETDIHLDSYTIAELSKDYLPLSVGNKWGYKVVNIEDEYVQNDILELLSKDNDKVFIAHQELAYYNGSNEEYEKLVASENKNKSA